MAELTERQEQILEQIRNAVIETATGHFSTMTYPSRAEVMQSWVKQHEESIKHQVELDNGFRPDEVYWNDETESVVCKKTFPEQISVIKIDIQTYGVGDPD